MRADRLLSILLLLQAQARITARELARRLDVSERTIHRDMTALSAAGIPVVAERGGGGGWSLLEDYRTDLTGLTAGEARSLFLATPARLLADLGLHRESEAAFIKLLAALPSAARRDAEYVRQRIYVDAAGWQQTDSATPSLATLQEAVWRERKLSLSYQRSDGSVVERMVDPLGLVAKGKAWYLVAAVEGEIRSYRASRVQDATVTDQPCVRPPDFDLSAYWDASAARLTEGLPRYPVIVSADPAILPRMRFSERYVRIERIEAPDGEGWATVSLACQGRTEACGYVLSFGPQIEVLEPPELREQVLEAAQGILSFYEGRGRDHV
ncbi:MAG: Helix-turn-helix type 11 domain protein [Chloroflexi bacterium]|nr:Helix-turn-helix type 11 domain protein [Chloroflexota bacterium]